MIQEAYMTKKYSETFRGITPIKAGHLDSEINDDILLVKDANDAHMKLVTQAQKVFDSHGVRQISGSG